MSETPSPVAPLAPVTPVAIVTGGSRGIGRAVVEAHLGEGYRVWLCSRSPEHVESAVAELAGRFGGAVQGAAIDVRSEAQIDAFVSRVVGEAGRLDVLVSNAGLGIFGAVDELTGEQFREVVETNLFGPFYFLRAAGPVLRRQGSGFVVHVASLAAKNPFAGGAAYNASKFGLLGLSEAAMLDLRKSGVRVSTILPGSVDTGFAHRGDPGADRSWMLRPEDVAATVLHLLSCPARALPSQVELRPTRTGAG
jgi:3-oxoacyl-[acyl-carrier protein] reductase